MNKVTDYLQLWQQIVQHGHEKNRETDKQQGSFDAWKERARGFHDCVRKKWEKPDSSRNFIVDQLKANPGSTFLDIGAGTGAWTCLAAEHCSRVTALEPSESMIAVMLENIREAKLDNIEIRNAPWPCREMDIHDFSLCSHSLYGSPDFAEFIQAMIQCTRKICFLLLRAPTPNGVMAEAAMKIWGQPHDSTNFQIAYNALMQMGIFPNVLIEDRGLWPPWVSDSMDDAVHDVKKRLGLLDSCEYDRYIRDLLHNRLTKQDGKFIWPRGVRSALVYWIPEK